MTYRKVMLIRAFSLALVIAAAFALGSESPSDNWRHVLDLIVIFVCSTTVLFA